MDGIAHAAFNGAAQDRENRRQAGAARHTQHGGLVFFAQVSRAQRPTDLHRVPQLQLVGDVARHATVGHQADMELKRSIVAETGHGIGAGMLGCELELCVLTGRKLNRLGRLQHQPFDVVRHVFQSHHGGLDDARRVHHDFVGLGNLDGAGLGDVGPARQHIGVVAVVGLLLIDTTFHHLARHHLATAGAASPRHARIRHRHLRSAQRLQQIGARLDLHDAVEGLNKNFHGVTGGSGGCGERMISRLGRSANRIP